MHQRAQRHRQRAGEGERHTPDGKSTQARRHSILLNIRRRPLRKRKAVKIGRLMAEQPENRNIRRRDKEVLQRRDH